MRRGRQRRDRAAPRATAEPELNRPFSALARTLRARPAPPPSAPAVPAPPASPPRPATDPELFARAMDGVVPLAPEARERVDGPAPAAEPRVPVSEESEALAALADLVAGEVHFDVSDTREYLEGFVRGLDPRLVRQLRRGELAWQRHLDLHGHTAAEARPVVERFLLDSMRAGDRCVLVVHGRGHNSKDRTPVLKEKLVSWLSRGALSRMVLAFTTARPCDGGAGAVYVLLRRDRRRRDFHVAAGTRD